MIRFAAENLSASLSGKLIVDRATFSLSKPELVAIIGPNGSGKTTLLRAMLGLVPATGSLTWSDDRTLVRRPAQLALHAAYLAQMPTAIAGQTVAQAIISGRFARRGTFDFLDRSSDASAAKSIARELALTELLERPIEELSGGQRQRVFLARCLAQDTPTMLLDEPATFLDLRHQLDLYKHLVRLTRDRQKTILMACHDLNLAAAHADRILVMQRGRIFADGAPGTVLTTDLLKEVYDVEMRRIDADGWPYFAVTPN